LATQAASAPFPATQPGIKGGQVVATTPPATPTPSSSVKQIPQAHAVPVQDHEHYCKDCNIQLFAQTTAGHVQDNEHYCNNCKETFVDEEQLQAHFEQSPFHDMPVLGCCECKVEFENQLELHQHLESQPHDLQWVLFVIPI
jgi:hypothetical protein